MTTSHMIRTAGFAPVLAAVLLALVVLLLRLVSLPLAGAALALDFVAATVADLLSTLPVSAEGGAS
ncbi:hypothetical protein F4561_002212 [Lipingzhangella halophila]|uniref:Uncharacterized protein n=1 Tax=Lipingzhangella halophila TaxID=1783352 RepID=A0A7W7W1V7_9ACTN|nr:hypothetical protein [Lipingzhangella halophila]MBB4931392.1 hypothetical protein [Lipingzhangella halophila]